MRSWLDMDPPDDESLACAYWCEMDYFLSHTATGDHPECLCCNGLGHDDEQLPQKREAWVAAASSASTTPGGTDA